jgi:hypothetical protein
VYVTAPLLRGVEADFVDFRSLLYFFHSSINKKVVVNVLKFSNSSLVFSTKNA